MPRFNPDEIKKGLEPCDCMDVYNCNGCGFAYQCKIKAHALAYIQQLEREREQIKSRAEMLFAW